jgi:hypothetical protein
MRVAIFDNCIRLAHIKNLKIAKDISSDFIHRGSILRYLSENAKTSVELIISDRVISCKSILLDKLSIRDVMRLAESSINKQEIANTACYELPLLKKMKNIAICTLFLNPIIADIVQQFLKIDNLILGITCWPIWIVDSYFSLFPEDSKKFGVSLFTVESEKTLEIIVMNDDKFICYRRGDIETFNKTIEEQNTIRYISQVYKINPNDIAIYHISNDTISGFAERSTRYMHVVSQNLNCKFLGFSRIVRGIMSCISGIIFCYLTFVIAINGLDLCEMKEKIQRSKGILQSVDKRVIDEADLWIELQGRYNEQYDFKGAVRKKMEESGLNHASKIILNVDETLNTVLVSLDESIKKPSYENVINAVR